MAHIGIHCESRGTKKNQYSNDHRFERQAVGRLGAEGGKSILAFLPRRDVAAEREEQPPGIHSRQRVQDGQFGSHDPTACESVSTFPSAFAGRYRVSFIDNADLMATDVIVIKAVLSSQMKNSFFFGLAQNSSWRRGFVTINSAFPGRLSSHNSQTFSFMDGNGGFSIT